MNIDFIKWLVGYAEGFEWFDGDIKDPIEDYYRPKRFIQNKIVYPLLLQRAIEGINQTNHKYRIEITYNMIEILDSAEYTVLITWQIDQMTFDQAKEEALRYVWEQKKK